MRRPGSLALLGALALVIAVVAVLLRLPVDNPLADPGAPPSADPESGLTVVALAELPVEARRTVTLIDRGGPFPYAKDGSVFGNRERLLPTRPAAHYREYTVRTPGEDDRGPRRIVTGDGGAELFYTADHYASFVRVRR